MLLLGLPPQRRAGANGMEEGEGYGVSIGKGWRFGGVSKTFFARYHPGSLPETGGSVKHFHKYLLKTSCVWGGALCLTWGDSTFMKLEFWWWWALSQGNPRARFH